MKKIAALVLALVLALSLATVAFAATTYDIYDATDESEGWGYPIATGTTFTAVSAKKGVNVKYYTNDADALADLLLVECDKSEADYVAKVHDTANISKYKYYKEANPFYDDTDDDEGASITDLVRFTDFGKNCEQFDVKGNGYENSDVFYTGKVNGAKHLFVVDADGVCSVKVSNTSTATLTDLGLESEATVQHEWKWVVSGATEPTTKAAVCKTCGVTAVGYERYGDVPSGKESVLFDGWHLVLDEKEEEATPATPATPSTGVESAKTFDAGVALYAGMALMSVAGSAVVIGKKKEF